MHFLFKPIDCTKSARSQMFILPDSPHQFAENIEIFGFRRKLQRMPSEKRNNNAFQFFPIEHLVTIAILMIAPRVFLVVNTAAFEIIPKRIENFFIFLDKLDIESRFYARSPNALGRFIKIADKGGKTAFTVHQTDDVIFG